MEKILRAYSKRISGDLETPITIFRKFVKDDIGFLLESKDDGKGRYSFIGKNPVCTVMAKDDYVVVENKGKVSIRKEKALDVIRDVMSEYKVNGSESVPFIGGMVGTVGYDTIRQYEVLPNTNIDETELPDVHQMMVYEIIAYDHFRQELVFIVLGDDSEDGEKKANENIEEMIDIIQNGKMDIPEQYRGPVTYSSNTTLEEYKVKVEKAKKYIRQGDIFQVVPSQRWTVNTKEHPFDLYRKLRQVNPSSYMFYINFGGYQVAGSSPETLVELRGERVYTCPIAGTRKRGKTKEEDKEIEAGLLADPKEKSEHVMLVDLGRNDMGRVSKIGSVEVTRFMNVKYYSHVMHLVSLVEGDKKEDEDMFSILSTFLPAGTLSGAPKIRAMEIIEELETVKRGIYGGAVGYFSFDGDMDMCIAIRTMVINDDKVYLQAGGGVVADSDPELEYEETVNKVAALISTLKKEMK